MISDDWLLFTSKTCIMQKDQRKTRENIAACIQQVDYKQQMWQVTHVSNNVHSIKGTITFGNIGVCPLFISEAITDL